MTTMNVVHMRVKPGHEADFLAIHREIDANRMPGAENFWLVQAGERDFIVIGQWENMDVLAAARPFMLANLDRLRPILEDLGEGRGVTDPWSGDVVMHVRPKVTAANAM